MSSSRDSKLTIQDDIEDDYDKISEDDLDEPLVTAADTADRGITEIIRTTNKLKWPRDTQIFFVPMDCYSSTVRSNWKSIKATQTVVASYTLVELWPRPSDLSKENRELLHRTLKDQWNPKLSALDDTKVTTNTDKPLPQKDMTEEDLASLPYRLLTDERLKQVTSEHIESANKNKGKAGSIFKVLSASDPEAPAWREQVTSILSDGLNGLSDILEGSPRVTPTDPSTALGLLKSHCSNGGLCSGTKFHVERTTGKIEDDWGPVRAYKYVESRKEIEKWLGRTGKD